MMANMIRAAQDDPKVKVILWHGGKFFGSGNDLSVMAQSFQTMTEEKLVKRAQEGIDDMNKLLRAMNESNKPIVSVVRGGCHGIAYTM